MKNDFLAKKNNCKKKRKKKNLFPKLVLRVSYLSKRDMDYEWFSLGLSDKLSFVLRTYISRQNKNTNTI